ncbi:uncharacterized protein TRUGW13939_04871 [Talaromyces rugulosus]|uniref:NmrA-like domain-containing protein n=1 Tax=Talaromyces rugulosus TaxID=121627 RepID=A0A7H8QW62_TALRU|nr:uncharacterized protein TRUGW13939_04871 [Talaromyces rugulosus]QKX57751.1 hypothetical protein TRUGW13939_04871 [Talaromyces rugulosus]
MSSKILITGAAGYIGGSLTADFLSDKHPSISKDQIIAAVRSKGQVDTLAKLGIPVLQLDLADEKAVAESILLHNVYVIIHTTSAIDPTAALNLITALGKQNKASGKKTYFVHTSGLSAFYEGTGWPAGQFKDTDAVFETEKQLMHSFPIRNTDISVIEHAAKQGVTNFVVVPSLVYGEGTGEWNRLSVVLPVYVQASLRNKTVYRFPENTKVSAVHISDLTALYGRIIDKVLRDETLPCDKEGYYFALAHDLFLGEVLDRMALALKSRGLIAEPGTRVYPNDHAAAESLGVPEQFVQTLWNSGDNIVADVPFKIGWRPAWSKERFFANINDEIDAVLEHGKAKSSLIDSLFKAA